MPVTYTTAARPGANYIVKVREVKTMSLSSLRTHTVYRGEIVRIDSGAVAYTTKCYEERRSAQLQAARYLRNYEHHLAKHGIGFEEQEAARKSKERAERKAEQARKQRIRDAAPDLLEALEGLLEDALKLGLADSDMSGSAIAARAAIAKARNADATEA